MGIAELASKRSKDPSTQHGVCIVDNNNRVVSIGYNGLPNGLDDSGYNSKTSYGITKAQSIDYWDKPQKYEYVVHAELNAILNATVDLKKTTLFLFSPKGYYPCNKGCAQAIIQSGIKNVVLDHVIQENTEEYDWSYTRHMFREARVGIRVLNR